MASSPYEGKKDHYAFKKMLNLSKNIHLHGWKLESHASALIFLVRDNIEHYYYHPERPESYCLSHDIT